MSFAAPDPRIADDIVAALRGWYFTHRRRLPWRDDPTPYRVWVSEIMLQQTQVKTVLPYFERFLEAFPTIAALAAASEAAVLARWSGLGYYRRARHLHRAAREVVTDHGGRLPDTVAGLRALPGIGRYTAGAIASIAFSRRAAVLDGNVARVLARVFRVAEPVSTSRAQTRLWALAEALLPDDAAAHNQALMELGALVCSPRAPDCASCPLADRCQAHLAGQTARFPARKPKVPVKAIHAVAGLVSRAGNGDEILVAKRPQDGLLGGLWELPGTELDLPQDDRRRALREALRTRAGLRARHIVGPIATVEHRFTHRHLTLEIFDVALRGRAPNEPEPHDFYGALAWVSRDALGSSRRADATPLSTLTRKVLAAVSGGA